jgi:hypothetical protein
MKQGGNKKSARCFSGYVLLFDSYLPVTAGTKAS